MKAKQKEKIVARYQDYLTDPDKLASFFGLVNHEHFNEGNHTGVSYHPQIKLASFEISNMCFDVDEDGKLVNFPRPVAKSSMQLSFLSSDQLRKMADLLNNAADEMDVLNDLV